MRDEYFDNRGKNVITWRIIAIISNNRDYFIVNDMMIKKLDISMTKVHNLTKKRKYSISHKYIDTLYMVDRERS